MKKNIFKKFLITFVFIFVFGIGQVFAEGEIVDSAPVITLEGNSNLNIKIGSIYVEPGFTVTDDNDTDLVSKVQIEGTVDTNTPGIYTLTYSVSDSASNIAIPKVRTVVVKNTTSINLNIKTSKGDILNKKVEVAPCDSDNNKDTPDVATPYCAVLGQGDLVSDWSWASFGVYLNSINGIAGYTSKDAAGNDSYNYWSWSLNNEVAMVGMGAYELKENDSVLVDFVGTVKEEAPVSTGGGGSSSPAPKEFSTDQAFTFLSSHQNSDGSYNGDMYTDWAAIALSSKSGASKDKIKEYLLSNDIDSSVLTDYERRAMALMSLGINPYTGTSTNYIQKIIDSFDGVQFGDTSLVNDDIFAIIVLKNAGFDVNDDILTKDIAYIISKQNNGSWGSIDMTAAGVEALRGFEGVSGVGQSITSGENYILSNKQAMLGNPFSASWVMQSKIEVIESNKYLSELQDNDGGIIIAGGDIDSRIWATSYTIPAFLSKTWNDILKDFSKQTTVQTTAVNNDSNQKNVEPVEMSLLLSENKNDSYILSTEKPPETPIIKNEKIKSNFKKDSISVDDFSNSNIDKIENNELTPDNKPVQNSSFLSLISNVFKNLKSFFIKLLSGLGF